MLKPATALLTLAAVLAATLPVEAQEGRRRFSGEPSITLYEDPGYQGRSITLYADAPILSRLGFADKASSARVEGAWRLCEDDNYRSRCEPFAQDVPDLDRYDFADKLSSVQQVGGRPGRPGFEGPAVVRPGPGRDAVEGRSVVFFRRPSINGTDFAAEGQASADAFCRQVGLGPAVYFDDRERGREALSAGNRVSRNVPVLRDVLCRR